MANPSIFKNSMLLHSYAKINLMLDVLGKRPDGYHELCMIMQTVSLYDDVHIIKTLKPDVIELDCANRYVPGNEKNIAYKAAKLIFEKFPSETNGFGLSIKIIKRIPIAGGLAGGSGNAAAVIKAMNSLFRLNLSNEKMCSLGLSLGADVPYCIVGGTMLSEGIGEKLTPLRPLAKLPFEKPPAFLLVNPEKPLSTAEVFTSIREVSSLPHANSDLLIKALNDGDMETFFKNTTNSLELPAFNFLPEISEIKDSLLKNGALGALMSGSGPTIFGFFLDEEQAQTASEKYISNGYRAMVTTAV